MVLNEEQKLAVYSKSQHIFLIAGAGSGKTRVIVERVKHLLNQGVLPEKILCITFTNKSSDEMKSRLEAYPISIHTFHGYCYKVLEAHEAFHIFEGHKDFSEQDILNIQTYKNSLKQTRKPKIYQTYQKYLATNNLKDFDDLMYSALPYLEAHTFKYIFIDEFQDTNLLQYKVLTIMAKKDTHIFAVGDPDQSIYAFRGARVTLINRFLKDFDAKLLKLELNYRSNLNIIKAANNLISHNVNRFKKRLIGVKEDLGEANIYLGSQTLIEAHIIHTIKQQKLFDAVILYRNHYQVARLRQVVERNYLFGVRFFSFHESKGLEFKYVFIVGAQVIPYDKDIRYTNTEEERRLLFVGMTRAMVCLYIYTTIKTKFLKQTNQPIFYLKNTPNQL